MVHRCEEGVEWHTIYNVWCMTCKKEIYAERNTTTKEIHIMPACDCYTKLKQESEADDAEV